MHQSAPRAGVNHGSYNLLTSGEYDPKRSSQGPMERLPCGQFGFDPAHQVHEYFREAAHRTSIPGNALPVWDNRRLAPARTPCTDGRRQLSRHRLTGA